jgi:hypothetical protein
VRCPMPGRRASSVIRRLTGAANICDSLRNRPSRLLQAS